jgi:serine/threonine-protein kinase RsbW
LANAIIHGNREDPSKKVEIYGACEGHEKLLLVITDEGQGFDPAAIPDPTRAENIFSGHGRGLFLINRLMCHAEHRLGGRQVVLRKSVARTRKKKRGSA